jgi:hypothetical protein
VSGGVSRGVIKRIIFVVLAGMLPTLAHASDVRVNYTGHYEVVDKHPERIFTLYLNQSGSRVHVTFSAADLNDAGARPTGEGDGRVNDRGILKFKFKDNFANEGVATLEPAKNYYRFEMRITKLINPGPLHFYGVLIMKKASDELQKRVSSN